MGFRLGRRSFALSIRDDGQAQGDQVVRYTETGTKRDRKVPVKSITDRTLEVPTTIPHQ